LDLSITRPGFFPAVSDVVGAVAGGGAAVLGDDDVFESSAARA